MEQNIINLDSLTITELKSLAYDRIISMENMGRELSMINQVIKNKTETGGNVPENKEQE